MTTQTTVNGVNVNQLVETINALKDKRDLARFQFRAHTTWEGGARSATRIHRFYGAGQEDSSRTEPHVLKGDEPALLLGSDTGPNAVETVLHALTSCLTVGFIYNAAAQGITVRSLEFDINGDLDLQAFLGLSEDRRPGYQEIHVTYKADADASREKLEELCSYVHRTSPVLDMLRNPVPVTIKLA